MIKEKILIFGSTGQVGRHLIRKFTKNNYKVICQTRNSHKAIFLKTSGSIGYIDIKEANLFDDEKIELLIKDSDICINLVGILYETGKSNTFKNIHKIFPQKITMLCKKYNKKFIHLSALGVENAIDSKYAQSKLGAEKFIKENLPNSIIIKPSIVFSVDDSFTTKFMGLLSFLPFFPLYYSGETKFSPIHASDLADLVYFIISKKISSKFIEAVGPEILSFREMMQIILKSINKKRILIPIPFLLAKLSAYVFQLSPKPLLTLDQLKLLKYDNIKSDNGVTNFDIGCPSKIKFKDGVDKYSYNWREGGQFSKKNINTK